jgi:hypothetical protein
MATYRTSARTHSHAGGPYWLTQHFLSWGSKGVVEMVRPSKLTPAKVDEVWAR